MDWSIELTGDDKKIWTEDGKLFRIVLYSREIMVISGEEMYTRCFSPVRIQSCMNPGKVRIEPVTVTFSEEHRVIIQDLAGAESFSQEKIQLKFKSWEPDIPNGHCGDCTKCRRCWA